MTLVAVWRAQNRLMAIADTRIISNNGVLTEHGPKLLPIKVWGKQLGRSGLVDQLAFQFDIGFAYSGATLLSSIRSKKKIQSPRLEAVPSFCGNALNSVETLKLPEEMVTPYLRWIDPLVRYRL